MRPKVIPAVLASDRRAFIRRLKTVEKFSPYYHLDLMDGHFVRPRSVGPKFLRSYRLDRPVECHLMVVDPWLWFNALAGKNLRKLIVHVELGDKIFPFIALLRSKRIKIDLAINPRTELKELRPYASIIDGLHLMSVDPGQYGHRFITRTISRIRRCQRRYPSLPITVDGGINLGNIRSLATTGVARCVVGSAIVKADRPAAVYRQLCRALKQGSVVK